MKWFRCYPAIIDSPKLQSIEDHRGKWCYFVCLCLASKSPVRGSLFLTPETPISDKLIAEKSQISLRKTRDFLQIFEKLDLLKFEKNVYKITDWDEKQFDSDSSRERVRKYRGKEKSNGNVTLQSSYQDRYCNAPDTDTDTDTDTDSINPLYPLFVKIWCDEFKVPSLSLNAKNELELQAEKYTAEQFKLAINEARKSSTGLAGKISSPKYLRPILEDIEAGRREKPKDIFQSLDDWANEE